jgi:hypothetical protein
MHCKAFRIRPSKAIRKLSFPLGLSLGRRPQLVKYVAHSMGRLAVVSNIQKNSTYVKLKP